MTSDPKAKKRDLAGEAEGRQRGEEAGGGQSGNDLLEDGQPRGVNGEGEITGGTHGGPTRKPHVAEKKS